MNENMILEQNNTQGELEFPVRHNHLESLNDRTNLNTPTSHPRPPRKQVHESSTAYDHETTPSQQKYSQQPQLHALTQAIHLLTIIVASMDHNTETEKEADYAIDHLYQHWKLEQTGFSRLYNACKQMKEHLRLSAMEADQSISCIHNAHQRTVEEQRKNEKLKKVLGKLLRENQALKQENQSLTMDLQKCRMEQKVLVRSVRDYLHNADGGLTKDGGRNFRGHPQGHPYHDKGDDKAQSDDGRSTQDNSNGNMSKNYIGTPNSAPVSPSITSGGCATLRLAKFEKPKRSISRSVMKYVRSFGDAKSDYSADANAVVGKKKDILKEEISKGRDDSGSHEDGMQSQDNHLQIEATYHIVTPTTSYCSDQDCYRGTVTSTSIATEECEILGAGPKSIPYLGDDISTTQTPILSPMPIPIPMPMPMPILSPVEKSSHQETDHPVNHPLSPSYVGHTSSSDSEGSTGGGDKALRTNHAEDTVKYESEESQVQNQDDVANNESVSSTSSFTSSSCSDSTPVTVSSTPETVTSTMKQGAKEEEEEKEEKRRDCEKQSRPPSTPSTQQFKGLYMQLTRPTLTSTQKPKTYEITCFTDNPGLQFLPIWDRNVGHTIFLVYGYEEAEEENEGCQVSQSSSSSVQLLSRMPEFGARLVQIGPHDLEQERWIMLDLIAFLKKKKKASDVSASKNDIPFVMHFRNDPVSPEHWEKLRARYRRR